MTGCDPDEPRIEEEKGWNRQNCPELHKDIAEGAQNEPRKWQERNPNMTGMRPEYIEDVNAYSEARDWSISRSFDDRYVAIDMFSFKKKKQDYLQDLNDRNA